MNIHTFGGATHRPLLFVEEDGATYARRGRFGNYHVYSRDVVRAVNGDSINGYKYVGCISYDGVLDSWSFHKGFFVLNHGEHSLHFLTLVVDILNGNVAEHHTTKKKRR